MEQKVIYIIKWVKLNKPIYQLGEIVKLENNRFMPTAPTTFYTLSIVLQILYRNYKNISPSLMTMGLSTQERVEIDTWNLNYAVIKGMKHKARPIGKKSDGTPFRLYMVDHDFSALKELKQIVVREHFEIVGLARSVKDAIIFLHSHAKKVDIMTCELQMPGENSFQAVESALKYNRDIRIFAVTSADSEAEKNKAKTSGIKGYFSKPLDRDKMIADLSLLLRDF